MTVQTLPDLDRPVAAPVTTATVTRSEYDPTALRAEIVIRFEHLDLLPRDQRVPDPLGARDAAEALLIALGMRPVDLGMGQRIARRVAALAGDPR
jgi:hypothetical protein